MNSGTKNKINPFLSNKIESLCIVCYIDLSKCESKSVQDVLPRAKTITVFQALKLLSDFHQLSIETDTLKICYKCFSITELAFGFQMLCNKSVESLKAYINHNYQDAESCNNIKDEDQIDLGEELISGVDKNVDDCDGDDPIADADEGMQTDEAVDVYEEEEEDDDKDEGNEQDSNSDSLELDEEELFDGPKERRPTDANGKAKKECPYCHKMYDGNYLRIHIRIHTGEMPYKCKVCGKAFIGRTPYSRHMRIHDNKLQYLCTFCGKTFRVYSSLKKHVRIHTGERPYVCKICGKAFRTSHVLSRHQVTHSDAKPFKCQECAKCFSLWKHLKQHKVVHSKIKPFECTHCEMRFSHRHVLRTHQAKSCQAMHS